MLAVERANYITEALSYNKIVLVAELSRELKVSEETIRKDLEKLEKQGKLRRVHGGAYLNEGYNNETPVAVRTKLYQNEKQKLARKCMDFISPKETIFLDCSTTIYYIAKELASYENKLTVVTNSLIIATALMPNKNIRLILLGGELNRETEAFDGYMVFEALERYNIDKAFISSAGLDSKSGMTDYTQEEADVRRKVLQETRECIYVADATKLGRKSTYIIGGVEKINYLVLEKPFTEEDESLEKKLKEHQVEIVLCQES